MFVRSALNRASCRGREGDGVNLDSGSSIGLLFALTLNRTPRQFAGARARCSLILDTGVFRRWHHVLFNNRSAVGRYDIVAGERHHAFSASIA
jgi:hypothetical protein